MKKILQSNVSILAITAIFAAASSPAMAQFRDNAFQSQPRAAAIGEVSTSQANRGESLAAEYSQIEAGTFPAGTKRRVTAIFQNNSNDSVTVDKVLIGSDTTVIYDIVQDDCSSLGAIAPGARCTIGMDVSITVPGSWMYEILVMHSGPERVVRSIVVGNASESLTPVEPEAPKRVVVEGLESGRLDFGTMESARDNGAQTFIVKNGKSDPITIQDVQIVLRSDDISLAERGCLASPDYVLKPGESCSITTIWAPSTPYRLSSEILVWNSDSNYPSVIPVIGQATSAVVSSAISDEGNLGSPVSSSPEEVTGGNAQPELRIGGAINGAALFMSGGASKLIPVGTADNFGGREIEVVAIEKGFIEVRIDGEKQRLVIGQ